MKFITLFLLLALVSNASALNDDPEFIPEASAACRIGENLVIGGDEEPQSMWLSSKDGKISKLKVTGAPWDDLEGLATFDTTHFFATTSHSRTKKGKRKPEREQLMLLSLKSNQIVNLKSWTLRTQIFELLEKSLGKELDMKIVESTGPNEGGLNIEGLAYFKEKLYLGLRSPVTKSGKALILVINNVKDIIKGGAPRFDNLMKVDLSGNGIRSLDANEKELLILAGSRDDTAEVFGLTRLSWGTETLADFKINGFESLLRPEGVVSESNGDVTFVQDFEMPQGQDIIVRLGSEI